MQRGLGLALRRAAAACAREIRYPDDAPATALFTIENERHTLGLGLAELVVAEAGSRPVWIGEGPPVEELHALVTKFAPRTLLVSASPASASKSIAGYEDALTQVACNAGVDLIAAQLTVYVIAYRASNFSWTGEQSVQGINCLAEQNNGLYVTADNEEELVSAFRETLSCPMISQAHAP